MRKRERARDWNLSLNRDRKEKNRQSTQHMEDMYMNNEQKVKTIMSVIGRPETDKETGRPTWCFVPVPGDDEMVIVRDNVSGYSPVPDGALKRWDSDKANAILGVSDLQSRAMLTGSMFGWHVPGADVYWLEGEENEA